MMDDDSSSVFPSRSNLQIQPGCNFLPGSLFGCTSPILVLGAQSSREEAIDFGRAKSDRVSAVK